MLGEGTLISPWNSRIVTRGLANLEEISVRVPGEVFMVATLLEAPKVINVGKPHNCLNTCFAEEDVTTQM